MAGKDETAGGAADWLGPLFERLKAAVERAADAVCTDEKLDPDGAEKLARRVGVIARAATLPRGGEGEFRCAPNRRLRLPVGRGRSERGRDGARRLRREPGQDRRGRGADAAPA